MIAEADMPSPVVGLEAQAHSSVGAPAVTSYPHFELLVEFQRFRVVSCSR
jgi:hypothetical protein